MGPPERRSVDDVTRTRAVRGSSSQSRPTGLTLIGIMHVMVGAGVHEASLSVMVARRAR